MGFVHASKFRPERHIRANGAPRKQAELLEQHRDLVLAHIAQLDRLGADDVDHTIAVIDAGRPSYDGIQSVHRPQRRRRARSKESHKP